jgi:hypothetical protein
MVLPRVVKSRRREAKKTVGLPAEDARRYLHGI